MSITLYNSWDISCKDPFGAVKAGKPVRFCLKLPPSLPADEVRLLVYPADQWDFPIVIPMEYTDSDLVANYYRCVYSHPCPQLLFYQFSVGHGDKVEFIQYDANGEGRLGLARGRMWQLTVYDPGHAYPAPPKGIMYQIFPDRFYNSGKPKENVPSDRVLRQDWGALPEYRPNQNGEVTNSDYFCGDLAGIEEKLEYLASMGVSMLYLNPIFEAHSNHRYNTADYSKIDPVLGNEDDFKSLCAKAGQLGISIILDGVFSHTGSDSIYFNKEKRYGGGGAYHDPRSPYASWYTFSQYPDRYDSWWGFPTLPAVRETDPDYTEFICGDQGVLKKWLSLGAVGWRLDVADELPDEFLDNIQKAVKGYDPQCPVIGEVWEDASNKVSYGVRRRYLLGGQLDTVMNYPFKDSILSYIRNGGGSSFYNTIMHILENYPPPAIHLLMNSLSTHDTSRAITVLAGEELGSHDRKWQAEHHYLDPERYTDGLKRLKLAYILQFGLPGVPCVYYGDEAGLSGYRDPFNRVCYPWGYENQDLVSFVRSLGKIRIDYPLLRDGDFLPLIFSDHVCSFIRQKGGAKLLFAVNRSDAPQRMVIPFGFHETPVLISGSYSRGLLHPWSGVIFSSRAGELK